MSKREGGSENGRLKRKEYEKEMSRLHAELCKLQDWVRYKGLRVIVIFEGRDAAGKGGTIRAITERVSPRVFRVVALPAPSDREKSQAYVQRYIQHFPAAGEVVIFDRSWYNRAGVEHVMGFCTPEQYRRFLEHCSALRNNIAGFWNIAPPSKSTSWMVGSFSSSIGWRLAKKSNSADLRRGSRIPFGSGSSAPWIWNHFAAGMIIPAPETKCWKQPTPSMHLGISFPPMIRRKPG